VLPTNGDGDFTTTRASVATRVNENGLIEEVASNVPRLDYSDGTCPSLLLEPSSTNLVTYSEDFTQWSQQGVSTVSNSAISPDGTLNADKITATTTDPAPFIFTNVTATEHTFSFYYKGEANSIGKEARVLFWFIGTATGTTLSVPFTLTGDWQRFESQITPTGAGTLALRIDFPVNDATIGDYGYLWGAQLEQNSYATSLIKTVGSATTRSADTANGAGDASTFNDSEGVLMAEISFLDSDGSDVSPFWQRISISDNSDTNRLFISNTLTENQIQVFVRNATGISFNKTVTISDNTLYNKIVLKYKANDFALWINGFELETDNTFDYVPSGLNVLKFSGATSYPFYGNTKQLQYFDSALNDSELEKLTSWTSFTAMANGQSYTII
jgi:hypothetical protein